MAELTTSLIDDALERVDAALDAGRGRGPEAAARVQAAGATTGTGGSNDVALMANLPSFGEWPGWRGERGRSRGGDAG